eukprot:4037298-Alexandrium_andersonii.AAC.1
MNSCSLLRLNGWFGVAQTQRPYGPTPLTPSASGRGLYPSQPPSRRCHLPVRRDRTFGVSEMAG